MKYLLLLLPFTLSAEVYECKDAFLYIQSNTITVIKADGENTHARRSYGAFCYDFHDEEKDLYLCIMKEGSTFHFTSSKDKWSEKCVRVD